MSRVTLHYDDGSRIDFNNQDDAVYHLRVAGFAGVVELRDGATGKPVANREKLVNLATGEE